MAAPAFDKIVGTASDASGSVQTLGITVSAGGVAIGDIIVVSVAWQDSSRVLSSIADSRGNTYRLDLVVGPGNNNIRGGMAVAYVGTALLAADTITLTFSGTGGVGPAIAARADAYSGFTAIPALDVSHSNPQSLSTAPTTGATAVTNNANDLLVVAFCGRLEGTGVVTGDASYNTTGSNNAGAALASVTAQYRIVSASAAYSATASAATSTDWESLIIAYKSEASSNPAFTIPPVPSSKQPRFLFPGSLTRAEGQLAELAAQQSHPSFDTIVGTWTRGGNDSGSLYGQIDENAPGNDADYITSTSS